MKKGKISEEYLSPNKSKTYLLPLIVELLHLQYVKEIINTFLYISGIDEEPIIGILYKYTDKLEFILGEEDGGFMYYLEELKQNEYYINGFELGDYSLVILRLPEELNYAYGCLIAGKYSWLSPEEKRIIIRFLNKYYSSEKQVINRIIGILNKSAYLRNKYERDLGMSLPNDIELSSKIELES